MTPFDLRQLRYIYYDPNNPFWGADLKTELTGVVQKVLSTPSLAAHLSGVQVHTKLPEAPTQPIQRPMPERPEYDFGGVWDTTWIGIRSQREHAATLVVPAAHGPTFTASMTVSYQREEERTIVQETLTGSARGKLLSLTGVNYTYVQQGRSKAYNLDSFELELSADQKSLTGRAIFMYGQLDVAFQRLRQPKAGATGP